MVSLLNTILDMFSFAFIVRALIVGSFIAICSALIGPSLVLKRYSMIGDGLSHVGFGSLAIATGLNWAPLSASIPIVIIAAFFLLRLSENSKIKGDAAIAMISTASLAGGIMIISLTTGMNTDVCNYMFGSILGMTHSDVRISIVLSVIIIITYILFYNKIFAVTFDENFTRATGSPSGRYNSLIAIMTAVTIVLGMRMMGAMLVSSLIVIPALTSMRLHKSFKAVVLSSVVISLICLWLGITISYIYPFPTGTSIVMCNLIVFVIYYAIGKLKGASFSD